ncbi:MAG: winged helix-turn-helix domain-containing protein [Caldilineaceae bacterium]
MQELVIDQSRCCVTLDGQEIQLTPQEYRLLHRLGCSIDQVVTKEELLRAIWSTAEQHDPITLATPAAVDLVVFRLRKKLGLRPELPLYLETRRGFGYILHHAEIVNGQTLQSAPEHSHSVASNHLFARVPANDQSVTPWSTLTRREWEIFLLLGDEQSIHLTNKALAQRLRLAEGTLKKHLQNIYRKLDVENRSGAALLAMRLKGSI